MKANYMIGKSASYIIVFVLIENGVAGSDFRGNL